MITLKTEVLALGCGTVTVLVKQIRGGQSRPNHCQGHTRAGDEGKSMEEVACSHVVDGNMKVQMF